jgi:Flp pilus assembly protein TadB
MTKIVILFVLAEALVSIFLSKSLFIYSFSLWIPMILLSLSEKLIIFRNRSRFKTELPLLLNIILLKMKVGHSFRSAMQAAGQNVSDFSRVKVEKILEALTLAPDSTSKMSLEPDLEQIIFHFRLIESESHLTIARLGQYRNKLKIEENFSSKTRRALHQVRVQSLVLVGFYILLVIFVIRRFGVVENLKVIVGSGIIFSIGTLITWNMGRKYKWKV